MKVKLKSNQDSIKFNQLQLENIMSFPILYSLQHCPYAMRARMGILLSKEPVMIRAIVLKNKPAEMLQASAKGTVPVLVIDESNVIDESLDIMLWALSKNDPDNLLCIQAPQQLPKMLNLINRFDNEFKDYLEKYKCAKRYHESNKVDCRKQCEIFIEDLEHRLTKHQFIMGDKQSLIDFAILPFIRQFAKVDKKWFAQSSYQKVNNWLRKQLESKVYSKCMIQFPLWLDCGEEFLLSVN